MALRGTRWSWAAPLPGCCLLVLQGPTGSSHLQPGVQAAEPLASGHLTASQTPGLCSTPRPASAPGTLHGHLLIWNREAEALSLARMGGRPRALPRAGIPAQPSRPAIATATSLPCSSPTHLDTWRSEARACPRSIPVGPSSPALRDSHLPPVKSLPGTISPRSWQYQTRRSCPPSPGVLPSSEPPGELIC